jgi:hypothetical protein
MASELKVDKFTGVQCRFDHYAQDNSAIDTGLHCVGIFGDLA